MKKEAEKKADELIEQFRRYTPAEEEFEYPYAKQCAIICVNEILLVLDKEGYDEFDARYMWWQEVLTKMNKQ